MGEFQLMSLSACDITAIYFVIKFINSLVVLFAIHLKKTKINLSHLF